MATTLVHKVFYPAGNVAPNVPLAMQTAAESVEVAITAEASKIKHSEYTTAAVGTTAGTARLAGALSVDGTKTINSGFGTPDVAGKYKILTAGVYAIDFTAMPSTPPGTINIEILGTSVVRISQAVGGNYGSFEVTATTAGVYLPANEVISFHMVCNNAVNVGARIRITQLQGA